MKFVIFSDIHGNAVALKECLKVIEKQKFDAIIWCGDYITDLPQNFEAIQIIQECIKKYKCYVISGNREQLVIDFAHGKKINIKRKTNIESAYNALSKEQFEWIESLPKELLIPVGGNNNIYVSHEFMKEKIDKCLVKIFGHTHEQCDFQTEDCWYINPGAVGIPVDGNVGAEFSYLEIKNDNTIKITHQLVKYNMDTIIEKIKASPTYNDEIKWGKITEKELLTGLDYPGICINEYDKRREKLNIKEESLEVWKEVLEDIIDGRK